MAKFDPYEYCRKHGVGSKTPITDSVSGIKVTLNGLPPKFTPAAIKAHGEAHGMSVSFPAVQVDEARVAKPKGGTLQGEAAAGFLGGWLDTKGAVQDQPAQPQPNGRQTVPA